MPPSPAATAAQPLTLDECATADDLRALLLASDFARGRDPNAIKVIGPMQRRWYSVVFRAEGESSSDALFLKIFIRTNGDVIALARAKYAAFDRVGAAMGRAGRYSVPVAYPFLVENGCLATEWVTGRNLREELNGWFIPRKRVISLLEEAGRWLRRFHHCGGEIVGRIDVDQRLSQLDAVIGETGCDLPSGSIEARAMLFLRATAAKVARVPVRRSWLHGDFKADNLVATDDRIYGIDFDVGDDGAFEGLHDVVNFLFNFDLNLIYPGRWRYFSMRSDLEEAFLRGYAESIGDGESAAPMETIVPPLPFAWLKLHRALRGWAEIQRTHNTMWTICDRFWRHLILRETLRRAETVRSLADDSTRGSAAVR